jgi:hypothetical protein
MWLDWILDPPKGRHTVVGIVERLRAERNAAFKQAERLTRERDEAREQRDRALSNWRYADRGWQRADAEVRRLRTVLSASDGAEMTRPIPAAIDDPESAFSQPSPPPAADGPRISDVPAPPVSEAAPVEEETVATDVTKLRALGIDTGLRPPLPGEITQSLPIVTAVLPLWSNPSPVSLGTGDRAHESVAAVVGGAT